MSNDNKCKNCGRNADGLPPCEKFEGHERPDGYYCDCGHDIKCHSAITAIRRDDTPQEGEQPK